MPHGKNKAACPAIWSQARAWSATGAVALLQGPPAAPLHLLYRAMCQHTRPESLFIVVWGASLNMSLVFLGQCPLPVHACPMLGIERSPFLLYPSCLEKCHLLKTQLGNPFFWEAS